MARKRISLKRKKELLKYWEQKSKEPYLWGSVAKTIKYTIQKYSRKKAIEKLRKYRKWSRRQSSSIYYEQAIKQLQKL